MSAIINVRYLTRYMLQNVSYSPKSYHKMSATSETVIPRNVRYMTYSRYT